MTWADLHLHSTCSDGADAPAQVVARAQALGIAAMALTDHDTTAGVLEAQQAAADANIAFLSGVEISAVFEKQEIHIIGLGIHLDAPPLMRLLEKAANHRTERACRILERLAAMGVATRADLEAAMQGAFPAGRMHVAVALRSLNKAPSVQHAFERFLNRGSPAYVPKELPAAKECLDAIHDAGGLAFVAHPGLGTTLRRRLGALLELPFDGIEAWHISHTPQMSHTFQALAQERSLLVTGGSDCHGDIKKEKPTMGRVRPPLECYQRIRETLDKNS